MGGNVEENTHAQVITCNKCLVNHGCGWLQNPFRTTQDTMFETITFVVVFKGDYIILGFLRWCEMDFVHPQ